MLILGLDASQTQCAAAVVDDGVLCGEAIRPLSHGQPAVLPVVVETALAAAGRQITDLDLIAVTNGPGSFTGLRTALALAAGLGLSADVPVIGVSVQEALAMPDTGGPDRGAPTPFQVAMAGAAKSRTAQTDPGLRPIYVGTPAVRAAEP
jgi:tRNA threonylcarbamoyl adenosine modification protein YeaZ